jgi:phosphoribosyl-ATP pyrophosphohydrolase
VIDVLKELSKAIDERAHSGSKESYVASLFDSGLDQILKKVGEEAVEVVLAGKNEDNHQVIYETADLWFHSVILLKYRGIEPSDVLAELEKRLGRSGLEEKENRKS